MSGGVGGVQHQQAIVPVAHQPAQGGGGVLSYVKGSYSMLAESASARDIGTSLSTLGHGASDIYSGQYKSGAYKLLTGLVSTGASAVITVSDATSNIVGGAARGLDDAHREARNDAFDRHAPKEALAHMGGQLMYKAVQLGANTVQFGTGVLELLTYPAKATAVPTGGNPGVTQSTEQRVTSALNAFNDSPFVSNQVKTTVGHLTGLQPPNGMTQASFLAEVFSGAHVVQDGDGGALYDQLNQNPEAYNRGSSHYDNRNPLTLALGVPTNTHAMASQDSQRGIDLPNGMGHLLFGTRMNNGARESWFQIEAHGTGAREFAPHMADFFLHKASGFKQVAPFGFSGHSEKTNTELHV